MADGTSLPAYTTMENIIKLIDALRRKNNEEKEAKPLFGMAGSAFNNTKSALRTFNIIQESSTDFTEVGRQIAYAENNDEKKKIIIEIILKYPPYEALLYHIGENKKSETEITLISAFWGKFNYGSTERNRQDGANLFGNIIEYIGFGTFIKGRGKNPTRIVWNPGFESRIQNIEQPNEDPEKELYEGSLPQQETEKEINDVAPSNLKGTGYSKQCDHKNTAKDPFIVIKADMTNWPEEKMKSFFKLVYGNLGDEDK